jgi:hypothetical protein
MIKANNLGRPTLLNQAFEADLNSIQYQWLLALLGRMLVERDDKWHCFPVILDGSASSSHETPEQLINTPANLLRMVCNYLFPKALEVGTRFMPSDDTPTACSMFSLEDADKARMNQSNVWICANDFSSQHRHTASISDLVGGTCASRSQAACPFPPFTPQVKLSAARAALTTERRGERERERNCSWYGILLLC